MSRYARRMRGSVMRRAMLNLYRAPQGEPTVAGGCDFEATPLLAFLDGVNRRAPVKITLTHVLVKMIGDSFRKYPELAVKVVGRRLYRLEHVDIRIAVNLFPDDDDTPEVSLELIRDADARSLVEIAEQCAAVADRSRRTGANKNTLGRLLRLTRYVPDPILNAAVSAGIRVGMGGHLAALGIARDPMGATALTNVGSFGLPPGTANVIAGGMLPRFGYASLFLALPIADKPWVVDGQLEVRPVLTLGVAVDHRAIDGYKMFRYFRHWAAVLGDPGAHMDTGLD